MTNLDASPYVGRLALCRVRHGTIRRGQEVAWCRADGTIEPAKVSELYVSEALRLGPWHHRLHEWDRDAGRDARRG